MISQRDLADFPISSQPIYHHPENPEHTDLPHAVAILVNELGGPLLRITMRLTALASLAPPPLRDQVLAQVDEIDHLMHTARELLLEVKSDRPAPPATLPQVSGRDGRLQRHLPCDGDVSPA